MNLYANSNNDVINGIDFFGLEKNKSSDGTLGAARGKKTRGKEEPKPSPKAGLVDSISKGVSDMAAFEGGNDKAHHCVMACNITKGSDGYTAQTLGGIKEMRDMGMGAVQVIVTAISPAIHDAIFNNLPWLRGGGFDDSVADMEANIIGELCACENCITCCRRYYSD